MIKLLVVKADGNKKDNNEEADYKPKKIGNSSESISASSTTKASGNKVNPKSIYKTNEVKKGNYSSMNGFVIVPKTIVTDYQKKIGVFHDYLYRSYLITPFSISSCK